MQKNRKILIGKIVSILAVVPALIYAHSQGPDPRKTGAPGDTTCAQALCHVGTPNTGGGKVDVSFPNGLTYTPGVKQRWVVTVTDSTARIFGFQLTARLQGSDGYKTQQAGTFTPADDRTFVLCEDGSIRDVNKSGACAAALPLEFIEHSLATSANTFTLDWTPPASASGDIKVWVAGNAANANGQADSGDHIYTAGPYTLTAVTAGSSRPSISSGGVTDALNYQPGIASATYIAIFGQNLSAGARTWDSAIQNGKLPMTLDDVSVTANGKPAAIFSISPGQVNILCPVDASAGPVNVVLSNSNGASDPITVTKTQYLPSFYAPFATDSNHLYATVVQASTGEILGTPGVEPRAARPVRPGEVILLYGTGFGQTNPQSPMDSIGPVAQLAVKPVIQFGQTQAEFADNGYMVAPGFVQFNLTVPDVPDGDYPLTANIGGVLSSGKVYITVKR